MAKKSKKIKQSRHRQEKTKFTSGPDRPPSKQNTLQQAMDHHRAGRLREAETLYRQILSTEPHHPEALNFLGLLAHQVGRHEIAAELISKAVSLRPDYAEAHNNLGNVFLARGALESAIASYRQALALKPGHVDALYNLGVTYNYQGKPDEAAASYRQALSLNPDFAEAHYNLGTILQAQGKEDEAVASYRRALSLKPDNIDALYNLGVIFNGQGKLDEAAASFRQALSLKADFAEALYNLGNTLFGLDKLDEAASEYRRAVALKPDYVEAHYNLGVVLQDAGKPDEAAASYRRALTLKPDYAEAYLNLGTILYNQGKMPEAVRSMQIALENAPANPEISYSFINLLNNYMPDDEMGSPYIKAQKSLQRVSKDYTGTREITDETVRKIYQECRNIMAGYKLDIHTNKTQIYRGAFVQYNCRRHKMVFNRFNIIPEYCFDCFKVTIEPRTVMELFKLLLVFDKLELPEDNPRKCIVEVRPEISGTYKGFIYCKSLKEGKEISNSVQPIVDRAIAEGIPSFVKRGCSEFQAAYPEYGNITDNTVKQLLYNAEWRRIEASADEDMKIESMENPSGFSHNHPGFTLLDILVMRNWLTYAEKTGDLSYLKIIE